VDLDGWREPRHSDTGAGSNRAAADGEGAGNKGDHQQHQGSSDDEPDPALTISEGEPAGAWEYREPDGSTIVYDPSWWYTVTHGQRTWRLIIGCARRYVHQAERDLVTIFKPFNRRRRDTSQPTLFPWVTFVRTDLGVYGAVILDPAHPKSQLKEDASLPEDYTGLRVLPASRLFAHMQKPHTLRLVVEGDDYPAMITHAFRLASLRKRL
jgi:hypothetical protein